tara:strand:- start:317 stop:709 length:393 start_codon:yes stop_codon:yes gene_type:complete
MSIAALKSLSPVNTKVFSPELLSKYTERVFGGAGGFGAGFGAAFFAGAFLGAAFLGAAFFAAGAFLVAALGAAVFFGVGMVPPIALKVSITGCARSWFDTGWCRPIVLSGWCFAPGVFISSWGELFFVWN